MNEANGKRLYLMVAVTIGLAVWVTLGAALGAAGAPLRVIEDPDGRSMRHFYESLSSACRGDSVTRILHYGDSHVAADLLTGALRRQLQGCFGDSGAGLVLGGKPYSYYRRPGVTLETTNGWQAGGLSDTSVADDGRFGLSGVSFTAAGAGETVKITAPCSRFDLYLLKQPGGGSASVVLDGAIYEPQVALAAPRSEAAYVEVLAETDGVHSLEVRIVKSGAVRILGVEVERDTPGIIYSPLGINGARMTRMLQWDWRILSSNIRRLQPDLIVVAYGSNEAGDADLDPAEYGERFRGLLELLHQAEPRASLLVIAPPDRAARIGNRWETIGRMPALVAAQRQAALAAGAGFFDLYHAMGGAGAIGRWAAMRDPLAQHDHVHLTGAGYRLVAGWLYEALMRGWAGSAEGTTGHSGSERRF